MLLKMIVVLVWFFLCGKLLFSKQTITLANPRATLCNIKQYIFCQNSGSNYICITIIKKVYSQNVNVKKEILFDDCLQPLIWSQTLSLQLHIDWQPRPYVRKGHLMSQLIPTYPVAQTKQTYKDLNIWITQWSNIFINWFKSRLLSLTYVCIASV